MKPSIIAAALTVGLFTAAGALAQTSSSSGAAMPGHSSMGSSASASSGASAGEHQWSRSDIESVQKKLQQAGYYKDGKIDGMWGPETRQALEKWQKDHNLTATGELDQRSLTALGVQSSGSGMMGRTQSGSSTSGMTGSGASNTLGSPSSSSSGSSTAPSSSPVAPSSNSMGTGPAGTSSTHSGSAGSTSR